MNTLNPKWNDFLFDENELNGNDKELKLMIQIYDDDGKKGPDRKDKLIGSGYFSLRELEAATLVNSSLPISDGKRSKPTGYLVVRSYKEHGGAGVGSGGYGAAPGAGYTGAPAYPTQPGPGYPNVGGGGYPGSNPGYPGQNNGYTSPQGGFPGPQAGYPGPQQGGYPSGPSQAGYPNQAGGYPSQQGGYSGQFPGQSGGYPPNQPGSYTAPGYPAPSTDPMFPPSNLPPGPGAGGWR